MSPVTQTIFSLAALLIGGTVLYAFWWFIDMAHQMKQARKLTPIRSSRKEFHPTSFNPAMVRPRLRSVRRDYIRAAHPRIHHAPHHSEILAQARSRIHRLGYIQHHLTEEDPHDHGL